MRLPLLLAKAELVFLDENLFPPLRRTSGGLQRGGRNFPLDSRSISRRANAAAFHRQENREIKKFIRVFGIYALVPLLFAGGCFGFAWRGTRQYENDKALLAAIKANDAPAVIAALKRGANPNARDLPDDTRSLKQRFLDMIHHTEPQTELYGDALCFTLNHSCGSLPDADEILISRTPNAAIIKALLDAGANPDSPLIFQMVSERIVESPLIYAERVENYEIAHLLLNHHANIRATGVGGETVFWVVAMGDNRAEVEYFLAHGANIEEEDAEGQRALFYAAENDKAAVTKCLIEHGADINHRDRHGHSALYYAAMEGSSETCRLLRQAGAVE